MSGQHYIIKNDSTYFLTSTVVDWIDVFTNPIHSQLLVDSLKYCQENMFLNIFAWCLMPSHLHMIANSGGKKDLSGIMRDFKKFTSKKIVEQIQVEKESRRNWMMKRFEYVGKFNSKIKDYKFWQDGNQPIEIFSESVLWQKINYIHQNPVKARLVYREQDWLHSSARNYYNLPSVLDVITLTPPAITVGHPDFHNVHR
jgi:putative transposase